MRRYGITNVLQRSSLIATELLLIVESQLQDLVKCKIEVKLFKFIPEELVTHSTAVSYLNDFTAKEARRDSDWNIAFIFTWKKFDDVHPALSRLGSICSSNKRDAFSLLSFKIKKN
ncbi:unnamed protein product [Lepeophtheirus salmonis]|uniref:(salmon louse) hypothetical protein n=1 Tax=Lepeophtheirus salmonis TaxID=72036 RepID=A0A7R8H0I7_LEPSM|nr:unnamed protein product [Lepeophtheirus salmonis]CAF2792124.1 unnamed protein product [Lepeophtheirus salmonis]